MAGNFGIGIGSFMNGLMQGAQLRKDWEQRDLQNAREERRLKLAETQDARDANLGERRMKLAENADTRAASADTRSAEEHGLRMKSGLADFSYTQSERAADAPIKTAERSSRLGILKSEQATRDAASAGMEAAKTEHEAARSRSIIKGVGADGKPTFTVDGKVASTEDEANRLFEQNHGTLMDRFHKIAVPQIQQSYLAAGNVEKAEAFGKWVQDAQVRKGIEIAGRLEGAFQLGDWDGVTKHFRALVGNGGYMALQDYDLASEPIKGKDGRTVGVRAKFRNKLTGETHDADYKDIGELHVALMGMVNPRAVFEWNGKQIESKDAAKVDMAKGKQKLANDIELEASKSALKIAEERARFGGTNISPKDYAAGVIETHKTLLEANAFNVVDKEGKVSKLPVDDQMRIAEEQYRRVLAGQTRERGIIPTKPAGPPPAPSPLSFAAPAPPAQRPAPPLQRALHFR
jgi:hypothetical protein